MRYYSSLFLLVLTLFLGSCVTDHLTPAKPDNWRTLAELPSSNPFFLVKMSGKLYVGAGNRNGKIPNLLTELWQYDFATDSWKAKKGFPGKLTERLAYFTVDEKLYVGLSQTGESDPNSTFNVEVYSTTFYEYNPATDEWKTIDSPLSPGGFGSRIGIGSTLLSYQNRGVALWGTFRTSASLATNWNDDGVAYDASNNWRKVKTTIYGTPTFPEVPDNLFQIQIAIYRVIRARGFGFSINNHVYTGGGAIYQFSTFGPFTNYDALRNEAMSHELYEFEGTEKPEGLSLSIINKFSTPSTGYDLSNAHLAFPIKNTGYIISNDGKLITFTPSTNQWDKFDALASPLVVGTSLDDKAYFINKANQLVEYTPN